MGGTYIKIRKGSRPVPVPARGRAAGSACERDPVDAAIDEILRLLAKRAARDYAAKTGMER